MRKIIMILFAVLIISCAEDRKESGDMLDFLPENSAVILRSNNPDLFFNNLQNNELFKNNKNYPLYQEIQEQLSLLDLFDHQKPAFLSFSSSENSKINFLFITASPVEIAMDSIRNKQVETLTSDAWEIKKYTLEGKVAYSSVRDSIFLFSNSQQLLQNSIEQENSLKNSPDFQTALRAASKKKPVVLINHDQVEKLLKPHFKEAYFPGIKSFSNWTVLDTEITQGSIKLNGITAATDTVPRLINVFRGSGLSENKLAKLSPANSLGFYSVSFNNFEQLKENLQKFRGSSADIESSAESAVFESVSEAGMIYLEKASVFALRTKDMESARLNFPSDMEVAENFREVQIYNYETEAEFNLEPLISSEDHRFVAFLEDFIIFSDSREGIKDIISSYQNESTLAASEAYISASENLSSQASILAVANNKKFKDRLAQNVSEELREATKTLNFDGFPVAAVQFIYQDDFAHVHAVVSKSNEVASGQDVNQAAAVVLGAEVATPPVFFKNHRTNGMDIAVQDEQNMLYLISPTGKIYWKKQLESRILGEIQTVDILRNGRYQLAFATQNRLHVIDRDGNTVRPFPLDFNDPITKPLAIFDYDNNRDYRFVITQGRELYMYDRKGNRVRGFDFDRASEEILHPPKHVRLGRKDYILVAEASGKLNILSRTGKIRVPVKEQLDFSDNDWYEHDGNFISTNSSGELLKINEKGKVTREATTYAENHRITATEQFLVSLSENELTIKGKTLALDFGLYTQPKIFLINNKIYVTVTDTQAHKVYLFDSNAELIPGFPVYGNSPADLSNADDDPAPELTVQGDEDSVLVYEVQ